MPQTSVILDVVIGAVMAIFLLLGMKKGFFRTLADLVLVFIAAFGANLAAKSLAGPAAKLLAHFKDLAAAIAAPAKRGQALHICVPQGQAAYGTLYWTENPICCIWRQIHTVTSENNC